MPRSTGCMLLVFCLGGLDNPFGYNALDTKALMMGRLALLPWRECNKERLLAVFPELTAPDEEDVHNALYDAQFQADIRSRCWTMTFSFDRGHSRQSTIHSNAVNSAWFDS